MKQRHEMPFGAEVLADGRVRFRLWAPGARQVEIELDGPHGERCLPMQAQDNGWFELAEVAAPGSRYRFRPDGELWVPDPASRHNPDGVHGASVVLDPAAYTWGDTDWQGRPWEEAVFYELHVGSFTPQGTFRAAIERLDYLKDLGVTAIELMPVAAFPGHRDWGYDGVLLYAPAAAYGPPEDLKALIDAAHAKGLMVFLDVVYNHFGPEGNYLYVYARDFFTERHHTPWGAAIDFSNRTVRDFFVHNALYWLEEYHFDGLRLDAVHAILDDSPTHILEELAEAVQAGPGQDRQVHLVLENDANQARFLARDGERPRWYVAQWNDDIHHAYHCLLSGETDGYYADYVSEPTFAPPAENGLVPPTGETGDPRAHALHYLGRCLTQGFAWQGEPSPFRDGERRGEPSAQLPAATFVAFLQNHDQIGNRAFGERLTALAPPEALRAAAAILLLAPSPPMLFMGEEFGATTPFLFFCDFGPDLRAAVRDGRRREFARFARFSDPAVREAIPDPNDPATFATSRLDWACLDDPAHRAWLDLHRELLTLRRREIVPRLAGAHGLGWDVLGSSGLRAAWQMADGSRLGLLANLSDRPLHNFIIPEGRLLWRQTPALEAAIAQQELPPWSVAWFLAE